MNKFTYGLVVGLVLCSLIAWLKLHNGTWCECGNPKLATQHIEFANDDESFRRSHIAQLKAQDEIHARHEAELAAETREHFRKSFKQFLTRVTCKDIAAKDSPLCAEVLSSP